MAKKINARFTAELHKNVEKGGAWIAEYGIQVEGQPYVGYYKAWANASAGKRWLKALVQENTPRKSIKMIDSGKVDEKGKPVHFTGELTYKVDA